jgi:hypothetical protein
MIDHKKPILIAVILLLQLMAKAQISSDWNYSVETQATIAASGKLPFWFRANQFGSIPVAGISAALIGNIYKNYSVATSPSRFNWSAGLQVRGNAGAQADLKFIEAYIKVKKGIFEASVGRTKNITGITDSSLSSGSFSFSGNALGVPQINIAIPDYQNLPIFNKLFSLKGSYAVGYFGKVDIAPVYAFTKLATQYFQQQQLYVMFGKPTWKLKLIGGINHNVMFGSEKQIFGPQYDMSELKAGIYAAIGKTYIPTDADAAKKFGGKVGNQIGSVDLAVQYDFNNIKLNMYHQVIYDVGAIGHLANLNDGITGISFINKLKNDTRKINWRKVLFEFVSTKDQAGQFNSRSLSGDEDYYNDFEFSDGWSYQGLNIGNPLLTSRKYTRDNLVTDPGDYIINNRVMAINIGIIGYVKKVNITAKITYSKNYGTYGTAIEGHSTGPEHYPPVHGIFYTVSQFSGYAAADKNINKGYNIGVGIAADNGKLYYNSIGLQLTLKKTFN